MGRRLQNRHNDLHLGKWGELLKLGKTASYDLNKQLLIRFYSIKFILDINLTSDLLFSNLYIDNNIC